MRGSTVLLAAASGLLIPSISAKCTYNDPSMPDSQINAWIAGCGQESDVARCFADGKKSMELYNCLVASGCSDEEAAFVQPWFDNNCEEVHSSDGELRRRQVGRRAAAANPAAKAAAAPAATAPKTTQAPHATVFARAAETSAAAATSSLVCLTTSQISTSKCFQPNTDSPSTTCTPTTVPTIKCNAGLLCQTGDSGDTFCMVKQNAPNLSGIIVSACLGAFFASLFGTVTFMACRSRVATRRAEKLREAELDAKSLGATAAMASEVYAPLIQEHAPRPFSAVGAGYGERRGSRLSPSASYQDVSSMRSPSPMRKQAEEAGGFADARNPLNPDDNDIGYGRQR